MKKSVMGLVAVALCAAAVVPAIGIGAPSATKPPIKIGVVLSLSGSGSSLGVQEQEGIELKAKQINAAGGVNGRKVVLNIVDDKSTPDQAIQAVRSLMQSFSPQAVIGSSVSGACLAMKPVTEQASMLQYCLSAAPIPLPAPYYFSAQSPFTRWIADVPVHWMVKNGIKSVGCLATNDSSGQLTLQVVQKAATNAGIKFYSQSFSGTDTDATPQLIKLRANNPDALYICTTGAAVVTALQGIKQLGFDVPVWISSGSASRPIAQLIKGILPSKGAFTSGSLVQVPQSIPANHPRRKIILAFTTQYRAAYHKPADIFAASGNDALNILTRAIGANPVGSDSATIAKYMEDSIRLSGAQLTYNFSPGDHRGTDVEGVIEKFTPAGGFKYVTTYPSNTLPRYATR